MSSLHLLCCLLLCAHLPRVTRAELVRFDEAGRPLYDRSGDEHDLIADSRPHAASWLKSAQDMIASPAGHVVVQMAKELLNRSAGNSQVLSLNLTNLLVVLLLKILIFSAGMLGAGHWSGYGGGYGGGFAARNLGADSSARQFGLAGGEDYLITGFLAAQGAGLDDCLYAAACASPNVAYEYAKAARALLEAIEKFDGKPLENVRYNDLVGLLETGAYEGYRGLPCNATLKCDSLL